MLVVEQNATIALDAADRAYVLEVGRVALEGTSDELRAHEAVRTLVPRVLTGRASCNRSSAGSPIGAIYASLALAIVLIYRATQRRQLRAGRDGDVHDVHRVVADDHHVSYWPAFLLTLVIAFAGGARSSGS